MLYFVDLCTLNVPRWSPNFFFAFSWGKLPQMFSIDQFFPKWIFDKPKLNWTSRNFAKARYFTCHYCWRNFDWMNFYEVLLIFISSGGIISSYNLAFTCPLLADRCFCSFKCTHVQEVYKPLQIKKWKRRGRYLPYRFCFYSLYFFSSAVQILFSFISWRDIQVSFNPCRKLCIE